MEAQDYCGDLKSAVSEWKTKTQAVMGEFETIGGEEKEKIDPLVMELRTITEQHTARMEELSKQCPNELTEGGIKKQRPGRFKNFWEELGEYRRYRIRI
jgi:hypothetical protein